MFSALLGALCFCIFPARLIADDQVLMQQSVGKLEAGFPNLANLPNLPNPFRQFGFPDIPNPFREQKIAHKQELAFMHVPYNFGHTVESVGMFSTIVRNLIGFVKDPFVKAAQQHGVSGDDGSSGYNWATINRIQKRNGATWGHANPDLRINNTQTGCPMYFSPPKYWPDDLAHEYFGNKTVFGLLRDPYERLVSMFRGNLKEYGNFDESYFQKCDVNGAVKAMMKSLIAGKNKFVRSCAFLPQAEYFDGPYGISVAVDNRRFPHSMNDVFEEFGYSNMHIRPKDIFHVLDCPDVWAGDLDEETKALVREVYKKDFDLICRTFKYCEEGQNVCLRYIADMCPTKEFTWDSQGQEWSKK